MNLVPNTSPSGRLDHDWDLAAAPVWIIDVTASAIVSASAAGWTAWGLDAAGAGAPVALDSAMPAIARLRAWLLGNEPSRSDRALLTFWTAGGVAQFACHLQRISIDGAGATVAVRAAGAGAVRPPAAAAPARSSAVRDANPLRQTHDVALQARLAHELRTPLSAVIAYAEILKDEHFGPLPNARYRDYARDIYETARHTLHVVDGMLAGDATRAGIPKLAFADLDAAGVVQSCLAVARPLAERAGLTLEADLMAHPPRIIADELSLKQMLLNLLANAIKFARRGDRIAVAVACDGEGPLRISVADTGPGMQAGGCSPGTENASTNAGLGLGLPLTRALAEANGAELAIESAPERGTRVTISFAKNRLVPV